MNIYHTLGKIPHKRHTQFRKADGGLYYEQLFGTEGFHGVSSLLYHIQRPTRISKIYDPVDFTPQVAIAHNITPRKMMGFNVPTEVDYLKSRIALMVNGDLRMGIARTSESMEDYFYKNASCDELLFVRKGSGTLLSQLGKLDFEPGDYIIIPRGVIYQLKLNAKDNEIFYLESNDPLNFPKRYLNQQGQFLESSPFCERDIRRPEYLEPKDEKGNFPIKVKKGHYIHTVEYDTHPFDVVGWDGYNYPFIFSIHDFEPITGRVHQPPPVHQTFAARNFVVCSFCPRLYDYHPNGIPAPYNHSNIDSDEVLYYVDGDFMSRNDIKPGVLTLHPGGIPHGPQPGATERSIGKTITDELAVMVDPFKPLSLTQAALDIDDGKYAFSWI